MNLAGFCRNCLANWYQDAAKARAAISRDEARAFVYGMPYEEWKSKHQREASESQRRDFEKAHKGIESGTSEVGSWIRRRLLPKDN